MTPTVDHLATLASEVWRASGARTASRLEALVQQYAETYFGSAARWPLEIEELVYTAREHAFGKNRHILDREKETRP